MNSLHRVDLVVTLMIVLVMLINIHYFFFLNLSPQRETYEKSNETNSKFVLENKSELYWHSDFVPSSYMYISVCFPSFDSLYNHFLVNVWVWIDLCIFWLIPFITMSVCSMIILLRIKKNSQNYLSVNHRNSLSNRHALQRRVHRNRQILYMLLLTNIYFLVSSMPYFVSSLIYQGQKSETLTGHAVVHLLLYTNNAVNFLLYGFSSEKYRKEFIRVFSRQKSVPITIVHAQTDNMEQQKQLTDCSQNINVT